MLSKPCYFSLRIDELELSSASKVIWYKSLQLGATQPVVFVTAAKKRTCTYYS